MNRIRALLLREGKGAEGKGGGGWRGEGSSVAMGVRGCGLHRAALARGGKRAKIVQKISREKFRLYVVYCSFRLQILPQTKALKQQIQGTWH